MKRSIKEIVLHCSDSPAGRGDDAETIHAWHKERGFDGIGYHFVIRENGYLEAGRPLYWEGAHVRGHNSNSIGICMIGNGHYSEAQLDTAAGLCADLLNNFPNAKLYGHYELDPNKSCPKYPMSKFRDRVQGFLL